MSPLLRVAFAFMVPILLVLGGTMGYVWIEGWNLWESLYMTVITITTVGYGEVHPLSPTGQRFTILLLMFSIIAVGYSVTTVISFVFEGQIVHAMRGRRMKRLVSNLKDHYIICGGGVVGKEVAQELKQAGMPFVIVDKDPARSELGRDETVLFVEGHAEDDEVLVEAGIHNAKGLIAVLREDALNVFVVLSARQANPDLTIVARSAEERTIGKLMTAGADRVMSPYRLAGRRIASVLLRPSIVDFLDVVVGEGDAAMRLEQFHVGEGSPLAGKQLKETDIGQRTGAIIVGIQRPDGKPGVVPAASAGLAGVTIQTDDVLIALGSDGQLNALKEISEH